MGKVRPGEKNPADLELISVLEELLETITFQSCPKIQVDSVSLLEAIHISINLVKGFSEMISCKLLSYLQLSEKYSLSVGMGVNNIIKNGSLSSKKKKKVLCVI